ncbi:MAG TPA: ABC transporter ATP-binding protein [Gemmatimonadaceae bacterium]|jgi:ATP-binding cassette subfamily B protein|nr:ABC transporter ATP-binding protein [Gemmatimonadaceae bacterium]
MQEDDVVGKAYDARLMRRLGVYVRPYGWLVLAAVVCLMIDGLTQLVGPLMTQRVIDIALPSHDARVVAQAAMIFAASLVVAFFCQYGETMLTSLLGQRVMRDLRRDIFGHVQRLPVTFFDRNPVGRLVTRVTSDVESLNELFTSGVVAGLGDLFTLLAISVMMLVTDWRLALASFAVIPFVYWVSHVFRLKVRESYRDIRTRLARINAYLQERITGMRIVQLFGREADEARRFDELNRGHLDANLASITYYALYFPAIEILTSIALALLIVTGAHRVEIHSLSVGTVAAFLQLVRRFFQPLQDLSDKFNTLQQAMAASERVFVLLDTPEEGRGKREEGRGKGQREIGNREPVDDRSPTPSPFPPPPSPRGVSVEFRDVWFAYDTGHVARAEGQSASPEWVLKGVSFKVEAGKSLALVGHTGAGKTTIINLLLRFYDPQRGRIFVDGVDVREIPLDALRALIGYVQQDIFLFAGDVVSNIRLSNALTEDEVAEAAARVGADRIIRRLPDGYSQVLGERGASISVGERQLLSFARAVAADPALLVLDEATSAVDSEIEAEIQGALGVLMQGRTTIAVAHRLSTIVDSDEILVLHHGHVRERGTHRELLAKRGLYDRLYRLQAGALRDALHGETHATQVSTAS